MHFIIKAMVGIATFTCISLLRPWFGIATFICISLLRSWFLHLRYLLMAKKSESVSRIERVKVENLQVLKIMSDRNVIIVKGAVPGAKNSYIIIEK